MTAVSFVDAGGTKLSHIFAGDSYYVEADFTAFNLPRNASYFIEYIGNEHIANDRLTLYSPFITDGAGEFSIYPIPFKEDWGPFVAAPGPNTMTAIVNPPVHTVTEAATGTIDPYADNSAAGAFSGISTPSKLIIPGPLSEPPTTVMAGAGFGSQDGPGLQVTVEDQFGNVVVNDSNPVLISVASGPPNETLSGTLSMDAVAGVATFNGLSLSKVGTVILELSRRGLTSALTTGILVTPNQAAQLVVTQAANPTAVAGVDLSPTQVSVEDADGNVETGDSMTEVTANLATGAGTLEGQTKATDFHGVVTFSGLYNDTAGPMSVAFSAVGLSGVNSSGVTVSATLASKLVIQMQPAASGVVGQPLGVPMIAEEDRFNNIEAGDNSLVVTASPAPGGVGPFQGGAVQVSAGIAKFTGLADTRAGTVSIQFGGGGLASATSTPVVIGKATPTINWTPATLGNGLGLTAGQLDAVAVNYGAVVPGTFTYHQGLNAVGLGTVLPLGPNSLSVSFTPNDAADYTTATRNTTVQVLPTTTATLTASAATVSYAHPITFTATVAPTTGGVTPTGSVTFLDGSIVLGTAPLDATGHAKFATTSLPNGTPSITASYPGSSSYFMSTSAATKLHVRDSTGADFDGDGRTDVAVYDQNAATFLILLSNGGSRVQQLGNVADKNIPIYGDFDGDGKTDFAVYDQTTATFLVIESGGGLIDRQLGNPADKNIPIAGDFDGDGKIDLAVFDQTASTFLVLLSGGGFINRQFGNFYHVNVPIAGDFDGDGKTDLAVFDQNTATFLVLESGGGFINRQLGNPADKNIPIAGDFDGDGKTDLAVFDQTASTFLVLESGGGFINRELGNSADVNLPVVGDFDGDGKADLAVYDETATIFLIIDSGGGSLVQQLGSKNHANFPA